MAHVCASALSTIVKQCLEALAPLLDTPHATVSYDGAGTESYALLVHKAAATVRVAGTAYSLVRQLSAGGGGGDGSVAVAGVAVRDLFRGLAVAVSNLRSTVPVLIDVSHALRLAAASWTSAVDHGAWTALVMWRCVERCPVLTRAEPAMCVVRPLVHNGVCVQQSCP